MPYTNNDVNFIVKDSVLTMDNNAVNITANNVVLRWLQIVMENVNDYR